MKRSNKILEIDSWETPWTKVRGKTVGNARISKSYYGSDVYHFEEIRGYDFYKINDRMVVRSLQRKFAGKWETWMVDDPVHWWGMKELCDRLPAGKVLCAGLGLGLMVHHLITRNDVTEIKVIEIDPDVMALISSYLPKDPRVIIQEGDYYEVIQHLDYKPDAILWDLAVGNHPKTTHEFMGGAMLTRMELPDTPFYQFGLKGIDNYLATREQS